MVFLHYLAKQTQKSRLTQMPWRYLKCSLLVQTHTWRCFLHSLMAALPIVAKNTPDVNQLLLEFIDIVDQCLIDTQLYNSPNLAVNEFRSGLLGGHSSKEIRSGISHFSWMQLLFYWHMTTKSWSKWKCCLQVKQHHLTLWHPVIF